MQPVACLSVLTKSHIMQPIAYVSVLTKSHLMQPIAYVSVLTKSHMIQTIAYVSVLTKSHMMQPLVYVSFLTGLSRYLMAFIFIDMCAVPFVLLNLIMPLLCIFVPCFWLRIKLHIYFVLFF